MTDSGPWFVTMACAFQAIGASAPVGDLGFVDFVAARIGRLQARRGAGGAIDVHDPAADSANQMMMVVADTVFEACGGAGRTRSPRH